jgi:hypothetical protein
VKCALRLPLELRTAPSGGGPGMQAGQEAGVWEDGHFFLDFFIGVC